MSIPSRLTIIDADVGRDKHKKVLCLVECECGERKVLVRSRVERQAVKSCGCYRREVTGALRRSHQLGHTPEYRVWAGIIQRCTNPNNKEFSNYGGRGVSVCRRWKRFENFLKDMGTRPSPQHSIDRLNPNGNYCLQNCRWATQQQQALNKRTTVRLTFKGRTRTLHEWAAATGIPYKTLKSRRQEGWTVSRMLTTPRKTT